MHIFSEGVDADVVEKRLSAMRVDAEKVGLSAGGLEAFDRIQEALRDLLARM